MNLDGAKYLSVIEAKMGGSSLKCQYPGGCRHGLFIHY